MTVHSDLKRQSGAARVAYQDILGSEAVPVLKKGYGGQDIVDMVRVVGRSRRIVVLVVRRGGMVGMRTQTVVERCETGDVRGERRGEKEGLGSAEAVGGDGWVAPGAAVDVAGSVSEYWARI